MIKIQNLHQPYIFFIDSKKFYVVSEILNENYSFFHHSVIESPKWKLHLLNEKLEKKIITTPSKILYQNREWNVIQECSGYVVQDKISYVVCAHTGEDNSFVFCFLVKGNFDIENCKVTDLEIVELTEAGFVTENDLHYFIRGKELFNNENFVFDFSQYFDDITRIMKIYDDENKILITGIKEEKYLTLIYDLKTKLIFELRNTKNENIYKSSILGDESNGELVYTKKHFDKHGGLNYDLNFESGYIIKQI